MFFFFLFCFVVVVFFPLFTLESLLYYSSILFYFTLSILYFISFYYYKFLLLFFYYYLFYFILFYFFNFFFPSLSSLFLTFLEVDMTALQFAGPSFSPFTFLSSLLLFYLLTPHPLILILTLFWGWHSCLTVCQSLNTYSFYFSTNIFYLILSLLEFQ